jgi:hypothetical protein
MPDLVLLMELRQQFVHEVLQGAVESSNTAKAERQ